MKFILTKFFLSLKRRNGLLWKKKEDSKWDKQDGLFVNPEKQIMDNLK